MKRFMFAVMAIVAITLTGCKKEDSGIEKDQLEGVWRLREFGGEPVGSIFEDPELFFAIEFYSDGSFDCVGFLGEVDREDGTYSIKGEIVTFYVNDEKTLTLHISSLDATYCKGTFVDNDDERISVVLGRLEE